MEFIALITVSTLLLFCNECHVRFLILRIVTTIASLTQIDNFAACCLAISYDLHQQIRFGRLWSWKQQNLSSFFEETARFFRCIIQSFQLIWKHSQLKWEQEVILSASQNRFSIDSLFIFQIKSDTCCLLGPEAPSWGFGSVLFGVFFSGCTCSAIKLNYSIRAAVKESKIKTASMGRNRPGCSCYLYVWASQYMFP